MILTVKALINFKDLQENKPRKVGDVFQCSQPRADFLLSKGAIEVLNGFFVADTEAETENVQPLDDSISEKIKTISEENMNEAQKKSFEEKKKEKSKSKRSRK